MMIKGQQMAEHRPRAGNCPYTDLHIYYLRGRVAWDHIFDNTFIGNWQEGDFSFLFFTRQADAQVAGMLESDPGLTLLDQYRMSYRDWQGEAPATFSVGRFVIAPPWQLPSGAPARGAWEPLPIALDPGVVFGNGAHPTTRNCIKALEQAVDESHPRSVLDLGTGTGLLALAAARLGCRPVMAVDLNHLAAKTALQNVRLNGLCDRIVALQGRAEDWIYYPADLLVANIHYDIMKDLIRSPGFLEKRYFILSGLLPSEARKVKHALGRMPVAVLNHWQDGGVWHTFYGRTENRTSGDSGHPARARSGVLMRGGQVPAINQPAAKAGDRFG